MCQLLSVISVNVTKYENSQNHPDWTGEQKSAFMIHYMKTTKKSAWSAVIKFIEYETNLKNKLHFYILATRDHKLKFRKHCQQK